MQRPIVELSDVSISFAGVKALEGVDFSCHAATTHGILGENGAGKSTLIKIISGVLKPDYGTIALNGKTVSVSGPAEAADAGIVCMFQELSLIPDLSVADNISLQRPPRRLGLIDTGGCAKPAWMDIYVRPYSVALATA